MTLDLAKVSPQLRQMSRRLQQRREELLRRRELASGTLLDWSDRWPELRDLAESRQRNQRLASPREPLAFRGPLPAVPADHRVVATDGSQIEPDRHGPAEYFLINIGQVVLRYGVAPAAMLASEPRLAYETKDLFVMAGDGRRRVPIQGSHLASLRAVEELQAAVRLADGAADGLPQVVLQDGTLLLWVLEERPDDFLRDAFLRPYGQALQDCQRLGQPLASYISRPRSAEVMALLRAATCGGEWTNCARLHPLRFGSDASDESAAEPTCALEGLHDRRLFEHLECGERSGLFATTLHDSIEKYYLGQRIHFFFLNVGSELARVEVPEWVAEDLTRLDLVHAVVFDQCRRGQGYPAALTRAHIELIASENFTSPAVMEAQGSVLTNKYAEGYPKKRWYGGCENVDVVEQLAIDRAKQLFGAEHANVQPHSGSGANMAVYFAFLKPGDKMLTMDLSHGGHLTHGNKANFSGKFFEIVHYGVRKDDERIDYDQLAQMAREHRPKMITVGASAYARIIDFKRMGEIAREVGALLLADIAHIAGLVAGGVHPSPFPHADFVTTTTHKTLRGPRGGIVMCREKFAKEIDSQAFPGIQGGPLMHVIAGKAVCLHEALQPSFKTYAEQIIRNAKALAEGLKRNSFRLISGGTDNHLALVDVGSKGLTGKDCQIALDEAGITVNKNTIPFETRSPFQASGIRVGSPAVTTRGMKEPEMAAIADMISEVLMDIKNIEAAHHVRRRVRELTGKFPLPY